MSKIQEILDIDKNIAVKEGEVEELEKPIRDIRSIIHTLEKRKDQKLQHFKNKFKEKLLGLSIQTAKQSIINRFKENEETVPQFLLDQVEDSVGDSFFERVWQDDYFIASILNLEEKNYVLISIGEESGDRTYWEYFLMDEGLTIYNCERKRDWSEGGMKILYKKGGELTENELFYKYMKL